MIIKEKHNQRREKTQFPSIFTAYWIDLQAQKRWILQRWFKWAVHLQTKQIESFFGISYWSFQFFISNVQEYFDCLNAAFIRGKRDYSDCFSVWSTSVLIVWIVSFSEDRHNCGFSEPIPNLIFQSFWFFDFYFDSRWKHQITWKRSRNLEDLYRNRSCFWFR